MKVWILEDDTPGELAEDRAFTHGLGVFETMLAVDRQLVRADLHFERLRAGCLRLGIEPPDTDAVSNALQTALAELAAPRVRARIMRTSGRGSLDSLMGEGARTVLSVVAISGPPDSVKVITSPWPRNEGSPTAGVKCSSYAENLIALDHARKAKADELIFPNTRGNLCEAAMANVFAVIGGRLVAPALTCGCLAGTARHRVIELAKLAGIEVEERPLSMEQARKADELFLTSATRGVVWVSHWDGRGYADRRVTERLKVAFDEALRVG